GTAGAYQSTLSGTSQDAFVAQLSASGASVGWLSYLGASGTEEASGLAVDASQGVYLVGSTTSTTGFPTSNGFQTGFGGGNKDGFVTAFNAGGGSLAWSSYLGGGGIPGTGDDNAAGLALDLDNNLYVVGSTSATSFPTASPFQSSNGGGTDAFLSKIAQPPPVPVFTSISDDTGSSASDQITTDQTLSLSGTAVAG